MWQQTIHDQHTEQTQYVRFSKMHHATNGSNKKSPSINSHHPFHFCTAALRGGVETVSCSIGSTHIRNTATRKIPADSNGTSPTKASAVPRPEPGSYPYMTRQLQPSPEAFASALTPVVRSPPARAGTRDVQARTEHAAFRGTSSLCVFSSWHLPKVLIRKSAIRACSGASTLKDQYLGQVPGGGGKKKERAGGKKRGRGVRHIKKNTIFLAQLLERSKRAKKNRR